MDKQSVYKRIMEVVSGVASDLGAKGVALFSASGLLLASNFSDERAEQKLRLATQAVMVLDRLLGRSLGNPKKTLILDASGEMLVVKELGEGGLRCYLSMLIPGEIPLGIAMLESEIVDHELRRLAKQRDRRDAVEELLSKLESHPLFKLLGMRGEKDG